MTADPFPEPFSGEEATSNPPGCGKPAMVGCAVLLVLLGIGSILFLFKATDLFGWALSKMEEQVLMSLPSDLAEETRQQLHEAFAAAGEAVKEGRADPQALQDLQAELFQVSQSTTKGLTHQQVHALIEVLRRVASGEGSLESGNPSVRSVAPVSVQICRSGSAAGSMHTLQSGILRPDPIDSGAMV